MPPHPARRTFAPLVHRFLLLLALALPSSRAAGPELFRFHHEIK